SGRGLGDGKDASGVRHPELPGVLSDCAEDLLEMAIVGLTQGAAESSGVIPCHRSGYLGGGHGADLPDSKSSLGRVAHEAQEIAKVALIEGVESGCVCRADRW